VRSPEICRARIIEVAKVQSDSPDRLAVKLRHDDVHLVSGLPFQPLGTTEPKLWGEDLCKILGHQRAEGDFGGTHGRSAYRRTDPTKNDWRISN
jgi:hypothetical protein